jgi:hypothetical protein
MRQVAQALATVSASAGVREKAKAFADAYAAYDPAAAVAQVADTIHSML